MSIEFRYYYMF